MDPIIVTCKDPKAFIRNWRDVMKELKKNPHYMPRMDWVIDEEEM